MGKILSDGKALWVRSAEAWGRKFLRNAVNEYNMV